MHIVDVSLLMKPTISVQYNSFSTVLCMYVSSSLWLVFVVALAQRAPTCNTAAVRSAAPNTNFLPSNCRLVMLCGPPSQDILSHVFVCVCGSCLAVFVMPNTAGQVAGACMFAFLSLLVFELLRPHLSQTDAWLYRIVSHPPDPPKRKLS